MHEMITAVKVSDVLADVYLNAKLREAFATAWILEGKSGFWMYKVGAKKDTLVPSGGILGYVGNGMYAIFVENKVFNQLAALANAPGHSCFTELELQRVC